MRLWQFLFGGLALAFSTLDLPTSSHAADGLFRTKVGGVVAQPGPSGPVATKVNPNSRLSPTPNNTAPTGPVASRPVILGKGTSNNGASSFQGWKKYSAPGTNGLPGGAAKNGNTGYTGIGLPGASSGAKLVSAVNRGSIIAKPAATPTSSSKTSGVAMFRGVSPAPSGALQVKANKLAGGVPTQKIQKGIFGEIGGAVDDVGGEILSGIEEGWKDVLDPLFEDFGSRDDSPSLPAVDVTANKLPTNRVEAIPNATTNVLPSKLVTEAPQAQKFNPLVKQPPLSQSGPIVAPGGSTEKPSQPGEQTSPPAEQPKPAPAPQPNPNPQPAPQLPSFPFPFPIPFPSVPSGPVVIERPAPVIVARPMVVEASQPVAEPPAGKIDLVLEDLKLASPATPIAGPAYRLKFRNQGTQVAGNFQVAILAGMQGKLADDAPRAVVEVPGLFAGESMEVTLRLPAKAMAMTMENHPRPVACTHLFVGLDFQGVIAELDESNNIAVVARTEIDAAGK